MDKSFYPWRCQLPTFLTANRWHHRWSTWACPWLTSFEHTPHLEHDHCFQGTKCDDSCNQAIGQLCAISSWAKSAKHHHCFVQEFAKRLASEKKTVLICKPTRKAHEAWDSSNLFHASGQGASVPGERRLRLQQLDYLHCRTTSLQIPKSRFNLYKVANEANWVRLSYPYVLNNLTNRAWRTSCYCPGLPWP